MVEAPEPRVMDGPSAERVEPEMMYWELGFGVMALVPMVRGGRVVPEAEGRKEVRGPYTRAAESEDVWSIRRVAEGPEPRVMDAPGERV